MPVTSADLLSMRTSHVRSRFLPPRSPVGSAFRPVRGVEAAPAGGSEVVLRAPHGRCVSLAAVAARVWTLLDCGASLRTIRQLLRREYGMPSLVAEAELSELLRLLERAGLIERLS